MRINSSGRSPARLSPLAIIIAAAVILLTTTGGAVAGGLITGAKIANGSVTGIDIKNRSLTGTDIKNNSLTSADVLDESRAWGASKSTHTDNFFSLSFTPILTRSLSTVRAGYLTITGTLYAEDDIDLEPIGRLAYTLKVDGKLVAGYRILAYSGQASGESGAVTIVVPVAKGTHTVSLMAREFGGGSYIADANLSIVYSPTGSSSGVVFGKPGAPRTANR